MTDTMDSDFQDGAEGRQPPTSQPGSDKLSSPGGVGIEAVLERLDKIERRFQSDKDRGVAATNKRLKDVQEQLAKMQGYLTKYPDPQEAARQMAIDELLDGTGQQETFPEVPAPRPQGSGKAPATPDVDDELLQLLGVSPTDPQFVAELQSGKSPVAAAKAVALSNKQAAAPNPAGLQPTGAGTPTAPQKAALEQAYETEIAKVRRGDVMTIQAIKEKYRKQGLNVW